MSRRLGKWALVARFIAALAVIATVTLAAPEAAQAQTGAEHSDLQATPKGTIGLGLIGAEIGLVIPAVAGLDEPWSLIVFPIVGAGAGAVAGYYAIDNNNLPELSVAMLSAGMALIIPAIVGTMAAIAYDPEDDEGEGETEVEVETDGDGDADEAPAEEASARRGRLAPIAGLVQLGEGGLRLGAPGLTVVAAPVAVAGRPTPVAGTEVHVQLLGGRF